ncbi:MAG: hypothetical protein L6263_10175, partial [Desulfobacteraceae bacterium]|nr:hypothetical protein [Desulfobacteraceae bacterium]
WYIDGNGTYAYLYPGNQTVQLIFNGARIWQYRTNDTFDLKYLGLYNVSGWWWDELDYIYDAYTTKLYNYTDFRPQAFFMPGINDYGLDTNSNGLYDYLVVEKPVNVTSAGYYEVDGYLYNSSGYYIGSAYNYTYLSSGIYNITLKFDGWKIYRSESTGNFTVYSYLYGYSNSAILPTPTVTPYPANIKEKTPEKPENFPDIERISAEKDVIEPKLTENMDINISALKPLAISQEQTGVTWWRWFDSAIDTTRNYTYTQFERPPARFNDVYSDYGLDTDSNGLYDYITIDVGVNVSKTGYYYVSGSLYNSSGWYIGSASNYINLNPGNQTVQLRFDGARIWQYRTNGTFDLKYLSLYNTSNWNELDYRHYAYTTKAYNYTDFRPQAVFMPGIKDYGLDENNNSLYDYLVVEKQVNVTVAGSYEVDCYLYNPSGNYIGSAYNSTNLNAGLQNITLRFDSVRIYRSNSTGNFTVYTYLYGYSSSGLSASTKSENTEKLPVEKIIEKTILEQKLSENISSNASAFKPLAISQEQVGATWWRWFDSAIDTTKYYTYTQFERPPARFSDIYSDYGLDTDSNGFYDYLVINVGVNVSRKGYYYVSGSLYDSSGWYWIGSASNYTKLKAGNNTLQLRFNGANIWQYRINGTFDLKYLYLYNASGWWEQLDYRYHAYTTKYYNYPDFDYPGRPDAYEPDDNYSNATYISTDGTKQTHNFHTPGDRDWMKFNATAGSSYILETSEPGLDSDTYMYLYAPELTEIAHDDDSGEGLASRIIWTGNTTDAYYIMVRHFSASVYGRNTHYNISVRANYTDIISYYRSLGSNPNVVETTDLLKAADDWSRDIAPPGFGVPITTVQLLALADEWSRS